MSKKILKLSEVDIRLLSLSAGELIALLEDKSNLTHVKQTAFEYYSERTKEIFHIQVIVTRDESQFLEPFQTEEMTTKKLS